MSVSTLESSSAESCLSSVPKAQRKRVMEEYRKRGGRGSWDAARRVLMVESIFGVENEIESGLAARGHGRAKSGGAVKELHAARLRLEGELGWAESPSKSRGADAASTGTRTRE
jgi:hypothetical protein